MSLTTDFHCLIGEAKDNNNPDKITEAAQLVLTAPQTPESDGLLALMYHEGYGVGADLDKACEYAERAAAAGDGCGLYLMGYMCDMAETPDQEHGGPRQRYDCYDAVDFMERCAAVDSLWNGQAHMWLGDYYMDSASGGDPDEAVEHYEAIGHNNGDAAGKLSDYYWNQICVDEIIPEEYRTHNLGVKVYEWTLEACRFNPHDYSYRMGWLCADGIGCDPSFRLARKYFEDAYGFGDWHAAEAIATLFEEKLQEPDLSEWERRHCTQEMESWRRLAEKSLGRLLK